MASFLRAICIIIRDVDGFFTWVMDLIFRPHYKIQGSCQKRGVCCRHIAIGFSEKSWRYPFVKAALKKWYTFVYRFKYRGEDPQSRVQLYSCDYLKDNQCSIHWKRPYLCRRYPRKGYFRQPDLLPGCGYKITQP